VTHTDIERGRAALGPNVERRRIRLEEPIKTLGEHRVPIALAAGVQCDITVVVEPLEAETK
jgi:large subunit ribosomal protein L9